MRNLIIKALRIFKTYDDGRLLANMPVGKKVLIRVGIWNGKVKVRYTEPISRMVA